MNKRMLALLCVTSSVMFAQDNVENVDHNYTHEITITVSLKTNAANLEQCKAIEAFFPLLTNMSSAQESGAEVDTTALLNEIKESFVAAPEYCKQHDIHGEMGISVSTNSSFADEADQTSAQ